MYPGRSRFDHCLHQLERVEGTSKPGLGVGDYRGEPVDLSFPAQVLYLIGSLESLIDSLYEIRNAVGRVEAMVRLCLSSEERRVGKDGSLWFWLVYCYCDDCSMG